MQPRTFIAVTLVRAAPDEMAAERGRHRKNVRSGGRFINIIRRLTIHQGSITIFPDTRRLAISFNASAVCSSA